MKIILGYVVMVIHFVILMFIFKHLKEDDKYVCGVAAICIYIAKATADIVHAIEHRT